ncbi:trypsin-like peptidase domain-containing protein [Cellulomonas endophytica]|uniref:trypsin-like peptidase domain-containing protein n=1 Tax=Cellulomonas endophytica TaxID=2494735 RepID=UPI0010105BAE|nr:trypsin-like peptidase domain-containing protein [Cellulomonas endophytica]
MSRTHAARPRRSGRRLLALAAATATAGSLLLAPAAQAAVDPAPSASAPGATDGAEGTATPSLEQTLEPSVVQLYIEWTGYVQYPTDYGTEWSDPVTVPMICTGFFVSEVGQIATAGHCVDPVEGRHAIIDTFVAQMVDEGWIWAEEAAGWAETAYANWAVEGLDAGSEPQRIIYAVQPKAVDGIVIEDPLAVQLVDFRSFDEGDVALLKADVTGATPLPVVAADPTSGMEVTSIGFPASVQSVVDASRVRASFKTGTVSSQQISELGVPRTEINADLSGGMSGGPTVDALGNVVGVNSSKIVGDQAFNFITDATDLHDWLTAKGVALAAVNVPAPEPTPTPVSATPDVPQDEDEGGVATWVWVAGGAGALVLLGTVALVAVLAGRRRRAAAPVTIPAALALPGQSPAWAPAPGTAAAYAAPAEHAPAYEAAPVPHAAPVHEHRRVHEYAGPSGAPVPPAPGTAAGLGQTAPVAIVPPLPSESSAFGTAWGTAHAPSAEGTAPAATEVLDRPVTGSAGCPRCGTAATPGQRFCGSCGGSL